ncbi:uncharacterized protein LOC118644898 [Monomorium pharaonis]|uniref:uncharacterized protein LOC118644898 n=1 Tax=Monomorium pharaonis TaxID=307658 RepID=UPI0017476927|nr:uncharacterized protein LOC118644898 [Monomorium pharaonis]
MPRACMIHLSGRVMPPPPPPPSSSRRCARCTCGRQEDGAVSAPSLLDLTLDPPPPLPSCLSSLLCGGLRMAEETERARYRDKRYTKILADANNFAFDDDASLEASDRKTQVSLRYTRNRISPFISAPQQEGMESGEVSDTRATKNIVVAS